jgi:hypothetical protein
LDIGNPRPPFTGRLVGGSNGKIKIFLGTAMFGRNWKDRSALIALVVMWITLIMVPATWLLVISLKLAGLSSSDATGWVQAIGSILAIIAAGCFPLLHSKISSRNREEQLTGTLRVLMTETLEKLWQLSAVFAKFEEEVVEMREYLRHQRERQWRGLIAAIEQIPIAELPSRNVSDVGHLRDAAEFGSYVAGCLPDWVQHGSSLQNVVQALRGKRDMLMASRATMPQSGISDPNWDWVTRLQDYEAKRAEPEVITWNMIKVYRRYAWRETWGEIPIGFRLQYHFPSGDIVTGEERFFAWVRPGDLDNYINSDIEEIIKWDIARRQTVQP